MATLRVAVVGGGIGGAATARALLRKGFDVHVFEQARRITEVGAGLGVAPNAVRILRRWGFGPAVERCGSRWVDSALCRADGTVVTPMFPRGDGDPPLEFYGLHRADLLAMLVAEIPPDRFHLRHRCVDFAQDDRSATVRFDTGGTFEADLVVGADGIHSVLQPYVVDGTRAVHSGSSAYRGTVPADAVGWPAGRVRFWMGEGKHFLVYPLRHNARVNYSAYVPATQAMRESWSAAGDPRDLTDAFAGWDPTITRIIEQITTTFTWGIYDREPLPRWTNGRLTLLGDAAHPMLPHLGQGANQAIEDAAALATVLEHLTCDVPAALTTYESIRHPRTAMIQAQSRRTGASYHASTDSQTTRDEELQRSAASRSWIFDYDAENEALAAATKVRSLSRTAVT